MKTNTLKMSMIFQDQGMDCQMSGSDIDLDVWKDASRESSAWKDASPHCERIRVMSLAYCPRLEKIPKMPRM